MGSQASPRVTENGIVVLPKLKYRVLVRLLRKLGYERSRSTSTHVRFKGEGLPSVTVPRNTDVPPGTLRDIISRIGMTKEAFVKLYEENR